MLAIRFLALGIVALDVTVLSAQVQMPPPALTPQKIAMGTFYDGGSIRVEGEAPSSSGVVVVIRGVEKNEFFNRKGRLGFIWLNADKIEVRDAPSVFLRFSSADVHSLLDRPALDELQLDQAAIMKRIRFFCHCKFSITAQGQEGGTQGIEPDPSYARQLHADFVALKEREGNYSLRPHAVRLTPSASPGVKYTLDLAWPTKAPPGDYRVEVYACRGQRVIASTTATLHVVEVGFPAYIENMASDRPWAYGAAAVLIAMFAGFLTDVFTSRVHGRKRRLRREGKTPASGITDAAGGIEPAESNEAATTHHG